MNRKKRILLVIDWFLPGFKAGGQIVSCYSLIKRLHVFYDFDVFTSDRDMGDTAPYNSVKLNEWVNHPDGFRIFYASSQSTQSKFKEVLNENSYDIVYLNSFFSVKFTILPLIYLRNTNKNTSVILAPRGMLGEGALKLKKLKKTAFILFAKIFSLYKRVTWHATSLSEVQEIKRIMGKDVKVVMAEDTGSFLEADYAPLAKSKNTLKIVFISRISRKKNLDYAFRVLENVSTDLNILFDIYGPIEDKQYWEGCLKQINELNFKHKVNYKGEVNPKQVVNLFQENHLFFFPTHHENFGHVVYESLHSSCPVLISDQTPWVEIEKKYAGFSLSLKDMNSFVLCVEKFARMDQTSYDEWRKGAFAFAKEFALNPNLIGNYKKMFD